MGHTFLVLAEFIRQDRQKECPHSVVMGILKMDMHMGQLSYYGMSNCIFVIKWVYKIVNLRWFLM